ncbi:uncharacterized protein HMPREF1541_02083 [Cyphellophora europaea CBS 101466]|uniref:N-acetyltransferase domain-containing protein n=1 Tax=Cyphellophora europaea (strain CBS 101466) TaxID=1220924 RepID=W2S2W4_CYPE1|nr:uncharacterized protein HMPREF1541_02083 [Cyphellophora europaea CBS 101466]ETN42925.1 hypothetical protein HMPREF1541_02083 [Cyphellophora europaea CBS 101466]
MAETTTPTYTIRHATQADVPTILSLILELAEYEKALDTVAMTEATLLETLSFPVPNTTPRQFTPGHARTLLVTPSDSPTTVAGMALYFFNYSTWSGPGIYLEDLIISAAYRKRGYGKALLSALAREVQILNPSGGRLQWQVLDWNTPSIGFYESEAIGARCTREWVSVRVDGEGVGRLAARR